MRKLIIVLLMLISVELFSQQINIIPLPQKILINKGKFTLSNKSKIIAGPEIFLAAYLQSQIQTLIGIVLTTTTQTGIYSGTILLTIDTTLTSGKEGYEIEISKEYCQIKAKAQNGLFYGIQSFLQLLPAYPVTQFEIPCLKIVDSPRFGWRGMHLDVSRHFFPKSFILKYIDLLALHKMNVFHWHLVDDQGWRIEIKKYPKLTEIGAWREDDLEKPWSYFVNITNDSSKKLYGGFYTQSDIREIVKYAADRQITIVPEIEMPGHCAAMIESYPEISCKGIPWRKATDVIWEFSDPVCPGNDSTFDFIENVLTEVMDLFPSKYIHIGGDECKKTTWKQCPKCQARMKTEHLGNEDQLQSYFIARIEKFLNSKNRKLIGWDEILDGGVAPEATVMSWRGEEGGIEAARLGHDVIMSPSSHCYFDKSQIPDPEKSDNYLSLEKVYYYKPIPRELKAAETKHILGGQGNVWTENMITSRQVEEMVLPRMTALSEVLWSDSTQLDFNNFLSRLTNFYPLLQKRNFGFYVPVPTGIDENNLFFRKISVTLGGNDKTGQIYYTTNGSEPDQKSKVYSKAITITKQTTLKARTILQSGYGSKIITGNYLPVTLFAVPQPVSNPEQGLRYTYYEGVISTIDSLKNLEQIKTGTIPKFEFPNACSANGFAVKYEGYIHIPNTGIYTFYTASDDGSMLYISDKLVVKNDGVHADQERSGQIAVQKGYHKICGIYFQGTAGKSFIVSMRSPGGKKTEIPDTVLFN